ncbi:unnamed protein product [Paramecium octaurelia]|uniref:RING-type domain-containing protein n=1 Tax=Paramecium octaurelia TaxID=43137 RepID=A0A8S1UIC4_PAROT|nr:unnamed protein product [Paramecium octaurelia]
MLQKQNNQQNGVQNQIQNGNSIQFIPVNPILMSESDIKNSQLLGQSFNQIRQSGTKLFQLNSNNIDYQAQDKCKLSDNKNQWNQSNPQISIKQNNSNQLQQNNMAQKYNSHNVQQYCQPPIQEFQRLKSAVSQHYQDYVPIMNEQQYNQYPKPITQPSPQPNHLNKKIKIINGVNNINPQLIEIDNSINFQLNKNANINNYEASMNTSKSVIEENLFQRQLPTQKQKTDNLIPQIDHSLFQRSYGQKKQITSQPMENTLNLQNDTLFKTKVMNCQNCRMFINNMSIGLNCQHFYHKECYQEIINQQIKAGKGVLFCICNQKIPLRQLKQNLPQQLIEKIFENQNKILQEIFNEKMRK